MKILITLLIATASTMAEPIIVKYDYPLRTLYNYNYAINPYTPVVRDVVSSIVPAPVVRYQVPYFAGIKSQYHDRDLFGQVRYGHVEPGQSHHAVQDIYGNKIGGFSYYNAEGKLKQTSYIADAAGYRVSSNDLPLETPEVANAKLAHLLEHEKIKFRSKRDAPLFTSYNSGNQLRYNQPPFSHAYPTTNLEPVLTKDGFLEDTPEVLAATADHFAKVADSKSRIAALQRVTANEYDYQRPITQNSYNPISHSTFSHPSLQQTNDYRYTQTQNFGTTSGVPRETPEVLAAKAKHFAELAANKARGSTFAEPFQQVQSPRVPISNTPVSQTTSFQPQSFDYRTVQPFPHAYPTTNLEPVVTRDGFLEETPEVLAAKANHFAQHAAAQSRIINQ